MTMDEAIISHIKDNPGAGDFIFEMLEGFYGDGPLSRDDYDTLGDLLIDLDHRGTPAGAAEAEAEYEAARAEEIAALTTKGEVA